MLNQERIDLFIRPIDIEPQAARNERRKGAQNVLCKLCITLRFINPRNKIVLEAQAGSKIKRKRDHIDLEITIPNMWVYRNQDDSIGFRFSNWARPNGNLSRIIKKIVAEDEWIQQYAKKAPEPEPSGGEQDDEAPCSTRSNSENSDPSSLPLVQCPTE